MLLLESICIDGEKGGDLNNELTGQNQLITISGAVEAGQLTED